MSQNDHFSLQEKKSSYGSQPQIQKTGVRVPFCESHTHWQDLYSKLERVTQALWCGIHRECHCVEWAIVYYSNK